LLRARRSSYTPNSAPDDERLALSAAVACGAHHSIGTPLSPLELHVELRAAGHRLVGDHGDAAAREVVDPDAPLLPTLARVAVERDDRDEPGDRHAQRVAPPPADRRRVLQRAATIDRSCFSDNANADSSAPTDYACTDSSTGISLRLPAKKWV
jgi:hypothetical protein